MNHEKLSNATIGVVSPGHVPMTVLKDVINQAPELTILDGMKDHSVNSAEMLDDLEESAVATIEVNPDTGEHKILSIDEDEDDNLSEEEKKEIEDRVTKNMESLDHLDLTASEVQEAIRTFPDIEIGEVSDLSLYKIIDIVKRLQNNEKFNVYRELPDELKEEIDRELGLIGLGGHTVEAKTARNSTANLIMDSFVNHLQIQRIQLDLNKEVERINNEAREKIIGLMLDEEESRRMMYDKYVVNLEKGGHHKEAELMKQILDSIRDAFTLEPMKEAARNHRIKVKKFDIEKPSRAINPFLLKYEKSKEKNIHSLYNAMKALYRNTRKEPALPVDDIYLFFVAFAKFCRNFDIDNSVQHAFMYYVPYNCMMLDIKGKDGRNEDFINEYTANIKEVISLLKGK